MVCLLVRASWAWAASFSAKRWLIAILTAPDAHTVATIWGEEKDALAELKTKSEKAHAHLVEVAHKAGFKEAA